MENMRKVRKTMMKVLGYLIIFLFMMMTAVGSYQIITRYFFNRPLPHLLPGYVHKDHGSLDFHLTSFRGEEVPSV